MGSSVSSTKNEIQDQRLRLKTQGRVLLRDVARLTREKDRVLGNMRTHAKMGNIGTLKVLSKQFVMYKRNIDNVHKLHLHLETVSNQVQLMQSTNEMASMVQEMTRLMNKMNRSMGLTSINQIVQDYEKMTIQQETIEDCMNGMVDNDVDEDESDEIMKQTLDECGIELANTLSEAPNTVDADAFVQNILEERLKNL